MSEYAVIAETHEGNVKTLRRGFASQEAAEDHPVQMSLWKRVWIEQIKSEPAPKPMPTLPPLPWDWIAAGVADARGSFHAYLVDSTGRKIAAIWGKDGEKQLIADKIIEAVNGSIVASADHGK
jgi:hypothetical protein